MILVRGVVAGLRGVDPALVDAARGLGFTARQTLLRVELPAALPVVLGGVRVATVSLVALATVAAWINAGGLGALLVRRDRTDNPDKIFAGALARSRCWRSPPTSRCAAPSARCAREAAIRLRHVAHARRGARRSWARSIPRSPRRCAATAASRARRAISRCGATVLDVGRVNGVLIELDERGWADRRPLGRGAGVPADRRDGQHDARAGRRRAAYICADDAGAAPVDDDRLALLADAEVEA